MRTLSKSDFKVAQDCPTKLYYRKRKFPSTMDENEYLKMLAEGGYAVGKLATLLYPGGVDLSDIGDPTEAVDRTNELMAQDDVIIFDGTGRHHAVSTALHLAEQGRAVQFATLDDNVGLEMEYSARVVYRKRFAERGVRSHTDQQLVKVERRGNRMAATFRHELTGQTMQLEGSQVIVENGTEPVAEVYEALRAASLNNGITDIDALLERQAQVTPEQLRGGGYELHRIGDAVTSRGVHSAIYDALRLASAL